MAYRPTAEHLQNEIPNAVESIKGVLAQLTEETGADDRYISLILAELLRDKERGFETTSGQRKLC